MDNDIFSNEKNLICLPDKTDDEINEIMFNAKKAYFSALKVFGGIDKAIFLSAYLSGYLNGIEKGSKTMKEVFTEV